MPAATWNGSGRRNLTGNREMQAVAQSPPDSGVPPNLSQLRNELLSRQETVQFFVPGAKKWKKKGVYTTLLNRYPSPGPGLE